jgi:hypothetical protein
MEIMFNVMKDLDRFTSDRIINIDDYGNVAWFIEKNDISFTVSDSVYNYTGVATSGVLIKSGEQWSIVQWHESY